MSVADKRKLRKSSEFFREARQTVLPFGDPHQPEGSTQLPFLEEALATPRRTPLVEITGQSLAVTGLCRHSVGTDERRAYDTTVLECFTADLAAVGSDSWVAGLGDGGDTVIGARAHRQPAGAGSSRNQSVYLDPVAWFGMITVPGPTPRAPSRRCRCR